MILINLANVSALDTINSNFNLSINNNSLLLNFERDSYSFTSLSNLTLNQTLSFSLQRNLNLTNFSEEVLSACVNKAVLSDKYFKCEEDKTHFKETLSLCNSDKQNLLLNQSPGGDCEQINESLNFYKEFYNNNYGKLQQATQNPPATSSRDKSIWFGLGLLVMFIILQTSGRLLRRNKIEKKFALRN